MLISLNEINIFNEINSFITTHMKFKTWSLNLKYEIFKFETWIQKMQDSVGLFMKHPRWDGLPKILGRTVYQKLLVGLFTKNPTTLYSQLTTLYYQLTTLYSQMNTL